MIRKHQKLLNTYSINLISLLNIILNFVFTLLFGFLYKVTAVADSYFFALIVFSNIFILVQLFYSTFFNLYLYIEDKDERNNLYYLLLIVLFCVSIIIIGLYFLITSNFDLITTQSQKYLNIYIFTLLFAPLIDISIQLMNARKEFFYAYYYTIGRSIMASSLLLINGNSPDLSFLAYGYICYDFLFFILIVSKSIDLIGFKYIYFDKTNIIRIFNKSFLDRTGQFLIGLPELFISNMLIAHFSGVLSIYSYIKKFTTSLTQFVFIPQFTIYSTNIANYLRKKKNLAIFLGMKRLWKRTVPIYLFNSFILAIVIKYILVIFLDPIYVENNILNIYAIYTILIIQNIFIILEYPYGIIINQKLLFSYALKVKASAFLFFIVFWLFYRVYFNNLYILLMLFTPSILFMFIAYKSKTLSILNTRREK